jgi:hypothetical protein
MNPFDHQYNRKNKSYDVVDTRDGSLKRSFFIEDGAAALRAENLADELWHAELMVAQPDAVPTPPACPGCGADINAYSVYVSGQFRCLVCARVLTGADYGTIDEDEDEVHNA